MKIEFALSNVKSICLGCDGERAHFHIQEAGTVTHLEIHLNDELIRFEGEFHVVPGDTISTPVNDLHNWNIKQEICDVD
jgi:hypothetical protein